MKTIRGFLLLLFAFLLGIVGFAQQATDSNPTLTAAKKGDPGAQYNLGVAYYYGQGRPKDLVQAVYWWRKAAEQGEIEAQYFLGNAFSQGEGVSQDPVEAMHWWLKAAEQGNSGAELSVGQSYAEGEGVPKDPNEARKWLLRVVSAEEREVGAMPAQPGQRVTVAQARAQSNNPAILAKWDVQQRFALAQNTLGLIYAEGSGVPSDMAEAAAWWSKAAERECAAAQFNLGLCYYRGLGEAKDNVEACKWMNLAASQGYGDAAKVQNALEQQMTIDQIAAAQQLTREFKPYQPAKL